MTIKQYDLKMNLINKLLKEWEEKNTPEAVGMINWLQQKRDDLIVSQLPL